MWTRQTNGHHGGCIFTSGRKWASEPKMASKYFPGGKNATVDLKKIYKSMKQDEYEQDSEEQPTRVAGKKPYGKCRVKSNWVLGAAKGSLRIQV
jgi:hypothetical protein